jgi:hypothetical protein
MGVAPSSSFGILNSVTLTGASQQSIRINNTIGSDATTQAQGIVIIQSTAADAFTLPVYEGMRIGALTKGAGATVTAILGINLQDQTASGVSSVTGIQNLTSSGAGKWGYLGAGTANNAFAGNTRFGGTTAPTVAVDVTGAISATTTIISSGATSGIGYTTGAGGAVTQATSRTTGVTLSKVSGDITLVSAAGTAAWQSFTVTNTAVAATDTIVVNQKSGADLNMIHITNVAAGSFQITFATTGGTTTEQPVFHFNVIKGISA